MYKKRRLLDSQRDIDSIRALPWKAFEDLVAEAYRRKGFRVIENIGGGADGGVDIRLEKHGQVHLVQCKNWKNKNRRERCQRNVRHYGRRKSK